MPTANEEVFDQTVRRRVYVLRFAEGEARRVVEVLAETEREVLERIAATLSTGADAARLEALLVSLRELREEAMARVETVLTEGLSGLAEVEADWERAMLGRAIPVELQVAAVALETIRALAAEPVQGLTLNRWLEGMSEAEVRGLERAIRLGVAQGETIDQIIARIRGTRANNYQDGVLATTRRNAEALARTAVSHASNSAREMVWRANADILAALRWTATLDGRTSPICRSRDGALAPIVGTVVPEDVEGPRLNPPGARPPAHFNCRSVMVPVLDGVSIRSMRPYVGSDRVGRVPAETTYGQWLARQPRDFQDDVLGPERAEMFRRGTTLDRFVDHSGRTLTLDELRRAA